MLDKLKSMIHTKKSESEQESNASSELSEMDITLDELGEIINNERRRRIVKSVAGSSVISGTDIGVISDEITELETGKPLSQTKSSDRKKVYVSIYQIHLPKLEGMGVLEWDKDTGDVYPTELTEEMLDVVNLLERITEDDE